MTFETPIDGTFSEFGDPIPFKVKVVDPEDGTIDCTKIHVTYSLGTTSTPTSRTRPSSDADCTGVITPARDSGHGPTAYVYHVLQAFYTDAGGAGSAPALTGEADTVLHPPQYAAETYPEGDGVGLYVGKLFVPGSGDWFMFPRINLGHQAAAQADLPVRDRRDRDRARGIADGPVVARFTRLKDSGPKKDENGRPDRYEQYEAKIVDPKGLNDLFFVTPWPSGKPAPEVFIGEFSFQRSKG